MKTAIILATIIATTMVLLDVTLADDQQVSTSTMASSSVSGNTYFGVDANDKEAVIKKQQELSQEKWKEMMGDLDVNQIDFSPEILDHRFEEYGKNPTHQSLKDILRNPGKTLSFAVGLLHDILFKHNEPQQLTTQPPPADRS